MHPCLLDTPSVASTVRPTPTRLPTSLRGLFDDDTALNDTLKAPLFPPPSLTNTLAASPPVPPFSSSSARERVAVKRTGLPEGVDDAQLAKYNEFAFPPRVSSRAKSKLSSAAPLHSRDEGQAEETTTTDRPSVDFDPTYEHVTGEPESTPLRTPRRLPEIDTVPPSISRADTQPTNPSATTMVFLPEAAHAKLTLGRNRSQTNFAVPADSGASSVTRRGFTSPSEFQFPSSGLMPSSGPSLASAYSPTSHSRLSPTHVSASSTSNLSPSHRPHFFLDAAPSLQPQRPPPTGALPLPPPINRTRSAHPADADPTPPIESPPSGALVTRKPSLNRQASVAVMESTPSSPLIPPIRPFAVRERSGSSSSKGSDGSNSAKSLVLPGLKDAVKVKPIVSLSISALSTPPGPYAYV
ncbi:hypothetical protein BS17DRAFT_465484 [Gyrodon lividus]|nr:hypothetical protein BS17DRAFT_465484 [Gyrodon lividus]